ncbi:MAG: NAD(P)/FAD-dependent oxidoreductase [Candidatus Dormibacteria bacterium]
MAGVNHAGSGSAAAPLPLGPGLHRVVIVGAGFAGLTLARSLSRASLQVTLVDRHNYHLFTPLLYQVASAQLNPSEIAQPVRKLVRRIPNCSFRLAEVLRLDLERRVVHSDRGEIPYDYLVVAAGSVTNYFGKPHLEERSLPLKSLPDALALRNWILQRFELAGWETDPSRRASLITFTVVGGGPTGVELAGALLELIHLVLRKDFRGVDISAARVLLVEASATLLGGFRPRLRRAATRSLRRRGVEVLLNSSVGSVEGDEVVLDDRRVLHSSSVIWTAGVRGAPVGASLGVESVGAGRVPVGPTLQLPGRPEVMVIGDLAGLDDLPMLAQVAMQQARLAARNIDALETGRPPERFQYRDRGIMATVGRNSGVAEIGALQFTGFIGWVMWLVVHLANIVTFRARLLTLISWGWDYFASDRPIRLLVRAGGSADGSRNDLG